MKMKTKERITRDSYLWNLSAGILNATQSVLLLIVITHSMPLETAGIFTIAYATANLLLIMANYGMRAYQVTDIGNRFTFREYKTSRLVTSVGMYLGAFAYAAYMIMTDSYSWNKGIAVFLMCIFKSIDAWEDVYHGMYQQRGRLDIGAKLLTLRLLFTMIVFSVLVIGLRNLNTALVFTILFSVGFCMISIYITLRQFPVNKAPIRKREVAKLLWTCFPIFLGGFLSFYIGNAPKYAIDAKLNDSMQACYAFLAMPVFVVGVLNTGIYQPILTKLAMLWNQGKVKELLRAIVKQSGVVLALTMMTLLAGFFCGIPVLSFLYNTDLSPYRAELLILLLAGGFLALSGFLSIVITIVRFQRSLIGSYLIVAILAYCYFPICVERYALRGASLLYLGLMILLTGIFCVIVGCRVWHEYKKR